MSKASEAGKAFLAGVLAKLPESVRGQAQTAFEAAEAESALEVLGTGALAQPEINRRMDELKAQGDAAKAKLEEATALYTRNQEWYTANEAALKEYPELKKQVAKGGRRDPDDDGDGDGRKPDPPPDMRTIAQQVLDEQGRDYLGVAAWMAGKVAYHSHLFNEALDPTELLANPKLGKPIAGQPGRVYSLNDAYTEKYGERVAEKAKLAEDKRISDLVEVRFKEEKAKHADQPFPIRGGAEPSVLDILADKSPPAHTVDTAIAEYERLTAARST